MDELPHWPESTVAILSTAGDGPHAIPVSTAIRKGPRTVILALGLRRASLARLREDGRCALTVVTAGDVAFTAHGHATIEPLDRIARVTVEVESIQDHMTPSFTIESGVAWSWTSDEATERDAQTRSLL